MTEERLEELTGRLTRRLGLDDSDEDVLLLLEDELWGAEGEIRLYLEISEVEEEFDPKLVELAALFYRRDTSEAEGRASSSYSEGQISQSDTWLGPEEYRDEVNDLLRSLAVRRQVTC